MNFSLALITLLSFLQTIFCQGPQERSLFSKWKENRTPDALLTSAGVVPIVKIPNSDIKTLPEFTPFYATPIQSPPTFHSSSITAEQIESITNLADLLPEHPTSHEISQYARLIPSSSIEPLDFALRTSAIKDKSKANKLLNILKYIKEFKLKPFKFIANKIKGSSNIPPVGLAPIQSYNPLPSNIPSISSYSYPQYPSNSVPLQFSTPELHSLQSPVLEYAPPKTYSSEKVYIPNTDSFFPSATNFNPSEPNFNPSSYSATYFPTNDFQVPNHNVQPPNVHYPYYPQNTNIPDSINPRITSYLSVPSELTGSASEDIESILPKPSSFSNHKLEQSVADTKLTQFSNGNYTQNPKIENENYSSLAGRRTVLKPYVVNEQQKETTVSTDIASTKSEE